MLLIYAHTELLSTGHSDTSLMKYDISPFKEDHAINNMQPIEILYDGHKIADC